MLAIEYIKITELSGYCQITLQTGFMKRCQLTTNWSADSAGQNAPSLLSSSHSSKSIGLATAEWRKALRSTLLGHACPTLVPPDALSVRVLNSSSGTEVINWFDSTSDTSKCWSVSTDKTALIETLCRWTEPLSDRRSWNLAPKPSQKWTRLQLLFFNG